MKYILKGFFLVVAVTCFLKLAAQVKARPVGSTPVVAPAKVQGNTPAAATNVVDDINVMFDNMEAGIEQEYAKLKQDCRANIDELNDKISQMSQQIDQLKKKAAKIEKIANQIEKLLPVFISRKDSIRHTPGGGLLNGELVRQQNSIDSLQQKKIEVHDQLLQVNGQINQKAQEISSLRSEIKKQEAYLVTLDKQKAQVLAELQKNREKSLAEAAKQKEDQAKIKMELPAIKKAMNTMVQDSLRNIRARTMSVQ
jgi:peptidoglycan hydrolase CwlO-like protein